MPRFLRAVCLDASLVGVLVALVIVLLSVTLAAQWVRLPEAPGQLAAAQVLILGIAAAVGAWYAGATMAMVRAATATVQQMREERKLTWLPHVAPVLEGDTPTREVVRDGSNKLTIRLRNVSRVPLRRLRVHMQVLGPEHETTKERARQVLGGKTLTPSVPMLEAGAGEHFGFDRTVGEKAVEGCMVRVLATYGDCLGRLLGAYAAYQVQMNPHHKVEEFVPICEWRLIWFHPHSPMIFLTNEAVWQVLDKAYPHVEAAPLIVPPLPEELPRLTGPPKQGFEQDWCEKHGRTPR